MQPNHITYIPIPTNVINQLGKATLDPNMRSTVDNMSAALVHYALATYWEQKEQAEQEKEALAVIEDGLHNLFRTPTPAPAPVEPKPAEAKPKEPSKAKPKAESKPKAKPKAEPKTKTAAKPKTKTTAKPKTTTKPKPKPTREAGEPLPPAQTLLSQTNITINGPRLRELRRHNHLSIATFAHHIDYTYTQVEKLEETPHTPVSVEMFRKIVWTLSLTPDEQQYLAERQ